MPSTNKTPNYNLNQWVGNDYFKREDLNADLLAIDTELKAKDTRVGPLASLLTTVKTSIVNAINSLKSEFDTHKAEMVTQKPHGISDIANKNYNRGVWTPTIENTTGVTLTYTTQSGRFQRIDDLFYINGYIKVTKTGSGGSNALQIGGLPITPRPSSINAVSGFVSKFNSEGYTQVVTKHDGTRYLLYIEFYLLGPSKTPRNTRLEDLPNGEEIEIYLEGSFRI